MTKLHRIKYLGIAAALISLNACVPVTGVGDRAGAITVGKTSSSGSTLPTGAVDSASIFSSTLRPVLQTNCSACHGTFQAPLFAVTDALTSHDLIISTGLVSLDMPANSRLVLKVRGGHQGIAASIADTMVAQITTWSSTLRNANSTSSPAPSNSGSTPSGGTTTPSTNTGSTTNTGGVTTTTPPAGLAPSVSIFYSTLRPVLQTSCAGCHGVTQAPLFAGSDPTVSHNLLISSALVDLNTPTQSRLVTKIQSGHSGIATSLATSIQTQIQAWSSMLAAANVPPPVQAPLTATFRSINERILVPKCVACHGATLAKDGVRYDTYNNTLRTVSKGNTAASKLYTSCANGSMPEKLPRLSNEELAAIRNWILNNAPND